MKVDEMGFDYIPEGAATPMPKFEEDELLDFLKQIEDGWIELKTEHEPQSIYAGNVFHAASNGWLRLRHSLDQKPEFDVTDDSIHLSVRKMGSRPLSR